MILMCKELRDVRLEMDVINNKKIVQQIKKK